MASQRTKVCYFHHPDVGSYYYGAGHPMKPQRLRMTHNLILNYGLYKKMEVYRPHPADYQEMVQFHSEDYVKFLARVTPDNMSSLMPQLQRFNMGEYTDCPIFDGLYDYCRLYTGGSIDGAIKLNHGLCDVAINWSGGLHHAKKAESSGFCYVNDIVLAILELLKYHARVLYIDIDIHHGDGVEEAFYTTDRVMTLSLHKFGDFFPGTGDITDYGTGSGKFYSVNAPLRDGITDETYHRLFKPVIARVMEVFRPSAVVLQCGADSLTGDRLGCFNLTLRGHAECVRFVKSFGLPTLVLGGGGYNIRNVSRCWTYETAVILDQEISNNIPYNDFFQYYGPDYCLHLTPSEMANKNDVSFLDDVKAKIFQHLSSLDGAPSVQMHEVPPDLFDHEVRDAKLAEAQDPDVRMKECQRDDVILGGDEYYEDERDHDGHSGPRTSSTAAAARASWPASSSAASSSLI